MITIVHRENDGIVNLEIVVDYSDYEQSISAKIISDFIKLKKTARAEAHIIPNKECNIETTKLIMSKQDYESMNLIKYVK